MIHGLRIIVVLTLLTVAKTGASYACSNYTFAGLIGGNADPVVTTFCGVIAPLPINQVAAPSGGSGGSAIYQWQISFNGMLWIDLDVSDGRNQNLLLTTPQMVTYLASIGYNDTQTTWFRRGVRRPECSDYLYSNVREFRVYEEVIQPGTFPEEYVICAGINNQCISTANLANYQGTTYLINPSGGTTPYEFIWQMSANLSVWTTFSTEPLPQICPPQGTRTYFRRGIRPLDSPCPYVYSNIIELYHVRPLNIQMDIHHAACINQTGSITLHDLSGNDPLVLGQFSYSINNGQHWQTSNVFEDLPPGNYTIIINEHHTKCSGCHFYMPECTVSGTVLTNPIPVIQSISHTPDHDCNATDRTITVVANGGLPPLLYSIDGNTFQTSPIFTGLSNGTYPVFVKNGNGSCEQFGGFVTLNTHLKIDVEFIEDSNPSDCGVSNGEITVYAEGGLAPLQYALNSPPFQTSATFSGLSAGNYTLYVRNADGTCQELVQQIQLNGPPSHIISNIALTHLTDCGSNNGTIVITASPTVPAKLYTIDGGNSWGPQYTFNNLPAGTYVIGVKNQAGGPCAVFSTIELNAPPVPVITHVSFSSPTDCNANNGTLTITAGAGLGTFQYSINGPGGPWQSNGSFVNLSPGGYEIWVRNSTGTCPVMWPSVIELNDPPFPEITAVNYTDPTDCGADDGTIFISASEGTGVFQYSISGSGGPWHSSSSFADLPPDSYEVWVRNSTGTCPIAWSSVIDLTDPPLPVIEEITYNDPTDCGADDGTISISATGGTGIFQYSIGGSDGSWQSSSSFTNLPPGNHEIWVRNSTGTCPVMWPSVIELNDPPLPVIAVVAYTDPMDCGANDGTILITAGEGTGVFQYSISGSGGPWQESSAFANLPPGSYEVWVRNATETCPVAWPSVIDLSDPPLPVIEEVTYGDPTDCGASNGEISVLADAGTGAFQYGINGSDGPWQMNAVFTGLSPGTYEIWVRNLTGTCPVAWTTLIDLNDPPMPVIAEVTYSHPTDCGANDGEISIVANAGTGIFQYSSDGPQGAWQNSASFMDLPPGSYEIWVRNATGTCPVIWSSVIELTDPPLPVIGEVTFNSPTDCGAGDGMISVLAGSGTGIFQYTINGANGPWQNNGTFMGLSPGSYEIWVRNADGTCVVEWPSVIVLSDPPLPLIENVAASQPTDCGANDGAISITVSGGTGSFQYSSNGPDGPWQSNGSFTNLLPDSYEVWVRNSSGTCLVAWSSAIELSDPPLPLIQDVIYSDPTDCDAGDGVISILANEGTGDFQYSIDGVDGPWQNNHSFTDLPPAHYEVWVRNATETCPVNWSTVIQLSDPPLPVIEDITYTDPTDCEVNDGAISISASGGTGTFQYSIDGTNDTWQNNASFISLPPGSYEVRVRNASGTCPVVWSPVIELNNPPLPVIENVTYSDPTDCDAGDGAVSILASEGTGDFQYSINGIGGPWQNSHSFTGLLPGDYEVWARNSTGTCPIAWSSVIELSDPPRPVITMVTYTQPTDCGADDGEIVIAAGEGTGFFQYTIDGTAGAWQGNPVFTGLPAGIYEIWVRNVTGTCPTAWSSVIHLSDPPLPVIDEVTFTDPTDCGVVDGTIVVAGSAGTGTFEYSVSGTTGPWQNSATFAGLPPGHYEVWIRNATGSCPVNWGTAIELNEPSLPVIENVMSADPTDCEADDGIISILVSAGTGAFQYSIDGANGNWQDDSSFTNLPPGSYEIWVRNATGTCAVFWPSVIDLSDPPLPEIGQVTYTNPTDCEAENGSIDIAAPGGTAVYEYSIDGNNWSGNGLFSQLPAGNYAPAVRNSDGTCEVFYHTNIILTAPEAPELLLATSTPPGNCGTNDASIEITAIPGSQPILYSINAGASWSADPLFSHLPPGVYHIAVSNADGSCIVEMAQALEISALAFPVIEEIMAIPPTDCGLQDAVIQITANAGTGMFAYSINGVEGPWQTDPVFPDLPAGAYSPVVSNADGTCVVEYGSVTIAAPVAPTITGIEAGNVSDCNLSDGMLTLLATDGQGVFQYSIHGAGGPWQSGPMFSNLPAATYFPVVRNADGTCVVEYNSVMITAPVAPVITDVQAGNITDCGLSDGSLAFFATGGQGVFQYSIHGAGGPWQSNPVFSNLPAGTYFPAIRNLDGTCMVEGSSIAIAAPAAPVIAAVQLSDVSDCGLSDGILTLFATGGQGIFQYSIHGADGIWQASLTFSNLPAGAYFPAIRNADGTCIVEYGSVTIDIPVAPVITAVQSSDVSDCGLSDGTLTLFAAGDQGVFQYSIHGAGGPWQSSPAFSDLAAGTYSPAIRNADGTCIVEEVAIGLSAPVMPVLQNVDASHPTDCENTDGTLILFATGGHETFEYSITGADGIWQSDPIFLNLPGGNYVPAIRNADGTCAVEGMELSLMAPEMPVFQNVEAINPSDCNLSDGTLTLFATGGQGTFQYSITGIDGPWQSDPVFSNLAAGAYVPAIRNADGTCIIEGTMVTITAPVAPVLTNVQSDNISDCGLSDGTLTLFAAGGQGTFQYSITGGDGPWYTSPVFSDLAAGNYVPAIRNADGTCTMESSGVNLSAPVMPVLQNVEASQPTDCGASDGALTLFAASGQGVFQYSITGAGGPWQSGPVFLNLPAGVYVPAIRNADGTCVTEGIATDLDAPAMPVLQNVEASHPTNCELSDGHLTLFAMNGQGSLQYSISGMDGPWQPAPLFLNLPAGSYLPAVRNADGTCPVEGDPVSLSAPAMPVLQHVAIVNPGDCGSSDGMLTLLATGSQGILEYSITGIHGSWQPEPVFLNLPAGNYLPAVRNADGTCMVEGLAVSIVSPAMPVLQNVEATNTSNCGVSDGMLTLWVTGGQGIFQYSITGIDGPWQPEPVFTGLSAGNYFPTVRNVNGTCSVEGSPVTVFAPAAPVLASVQSGNVSDCGLSDGTLTLLATDDQGVFQYSVTGAGGPWQSSPVFSNLPAGSYTPAIGNVDGTCVTEGVPVNLIAPAMPALQNPEASHPGDCDVADGSLTLFATSGQGIFEYSINGIDGPWQTNPVFSNLAAGTYVPAVRNADGTCVAEGMPVNLDAPEMPVLQHVEMSGPTDCSLENGSLALVATNGQGVFQYSISGINGPWQADSLFLNLPAGSYTPAIRNADGTCIVQGSVITITASAVPLLLQVSSGDISDCNLSDGTLTLVATGGQGVFQYSSTGAGGPWQSGPVFLNLPAGIYVPSIRNADGSCPVEGPPVFLQAPAMPVLTDVEVFQPSDCVIHDGRIVITATGGTGVYQYSIHGLSGPWQYSPTFTDLSSGSYRPAIRNELGSCPVQFPDSVMLNAPGELSFDNILPITPSTCTANNGEILLLVAGSTADIYEYSLDDGHTWQPENLFDGLTAGIYLARARLAGGSCAMTQSVVINLIPSFAPVISEVMAIDPVECHTPDGSIAIALEQVLEGLLYSIDGGGQWHNTAIFTGLEGGIYQVAVWDTSHHCRIDYPLEIVLTAPVAPLISTVLTVDPTTCFPADGQIQLLMADTMRVYEMSINEGLDWQSQTLWQHLPPGNYQVMIRNADGHCPVALPAPVSLEAPFVLPQVDLLVSGAGDCHGNGGSIAITQSASELYYAIDGGLTWQTEGLFEQLLPGYYLLHLRDSLTGCIALYPDTIYVGGYFPLEVSLSGLAEPACADEPDGMLAVTATGGMAPYGFQWSQGPASSHWEALLPGTYEIVVGDARNCFDTLLVSLTAADTVRLAGLLPDTILCEGQAVLYGINPQSFTSIHWSGETGFSSGDPEVEISEAGLYIVETSSHAGCLHRDSFQVQGLDQELYADFLLPAEGVINEPVVAVDISWPVPQQIHWFYEDSRIISVQSLPTQEVLKFTESGVYVIGLEVFAGPCHTYLEKEIRIYATRDSLGNNGSPALMPQSIRSFEIYPNPNNGAFQAKLVLSEPASARIWLFRGDGTQIEHRELAGADFYTEIYAWSGLPPGVYTALAQSGADWMYVNFVIQ